MTSNLNISLSETCNRYKRIYVPAVADILDDKGFWHKIMDSEVKGLTLDMMLAGPAFTILGQPERSLDKSIRKGAMVIDHISPFEIAVMDTCGDTRVGHWGELLSNGAIHRGSGGAVIDGGVRDTSQVLKLNYPVFAKFRCPADAKGRWNVTEMQIPVTCGGVIVNPGDFIFGDADGVVVIPKELTLEVLLEAEGVVQTENEIRTKIKEGHAVGELYNKYNRF